MIGLAIFIYAAERSSSEPIKRAGRRLSGAIGALVGIAFVLAIAFVAMQAVWPEHWIAVTDSQWHVEADGILVLDLVMIRNETPFDLKDFVVGCDAKGNSGTTITTLKTKIYEVLLRNRSKQFSSLRLLGKYPDQAVSVSCRVLDAHYHWTKRT